MKLSDLFKSTKHSLEKPVKQALNSLAELFDSASTDDKDDRGTTLKALLSLLGAVLWANGKIDQEELYEVRKFLASRYSFDEVRKLIKYIENQKKINLTEALANLESVSREEKLGILRVLIEICFADGEYTDAERAVITTTAHAFEIEQELITELEQEIVEEKKKRKNFLKSSAGIIAAIIILIIFVLTATFLKSVLFGLIFAYFFVPVERWFETKFFHNKLVKNAISLIKAPFKPFVSLKQRMSGLFFKAERSAIPAEIAPEEAVEKEEIKTLNLACHATVISVLGAALLPALFFLLFSAGYVHHLGINIKSWADQTVAESRETPPAVKDFTDVKRISQNKQPTEAVPQTAMPQTVVTDSSVQTTHRKPKSQSYFSSLFDGVLEKLEKFKPKLERLPAFKWARDEVAGYINNDSNRKQLLSFLVHKSGGVFSYTAGLISTAAVLFFDAVLTVFFFSFFLQKLAMFNYRSRNRSDSDYLVMSIFGSSWMPELSESSLKEARDIINSIFFKMKVWVRSYLSIIIIESLIYITAFFILGVPYPLILGLIAGCTILLPFIGPIISCALTLIVCFAVSPATSILFALIIILTYCIMNGIVEQLFLFPALAGEALGLTALETIIVVLLGGLFAGIPGMIFAVPATSVLKYLIPKIYECWR